MSKRARKSKVEMIRCIVLKDFWREAIDDEHADAGGNVRVRRGTYTDLTSDDAFTAIEAGTAMRDTPQNREKLTREITEAEEAARLRSQEFDAEHVSAHKVNAVA